MWKMDIEINNWFKERYICRLTNDHYPNIGMIYPIRDWDITNRQVGILLNRLAV